jgi:hypothetical protein
MGYELRRSQRYAVPLDTHNQDNSLSVNSVSKLSLSLAPRPALSQRITMCDHPRMFWLSAVGVLEHSPVPATMLYAGYGNEPHPR